jgi:hypothetical protein
MTIGQYVKRRTVAAALIAALSGAFFPAVAQEPSGADRAAIIQTVDAIGFYADRRDWDRVVEQFSPHGVVLDYRSYANASAGTDVEPSRQSPAQVVAAWQTVLPGYDYTHHIVSNHQVSISGDEAIVLSAIHATHILGERSWVILGDYRHQLQRTTQGWKITQMTANMRAQLGDNQLPQAAMEVVAGRKSD